MASLDNLPGKTNLPAPEVVVPQELSHSAFPALVNAPPPVVPVAQPGVQPVGMQPVAQPVGMQPVAGMQPATAYQPGVPMAGQPVTMQPQVPGVVPGMMPQAGYPQPGYPQPGYPQPGAYNPAVMQQPMMSPYMAPPPAPAAPNITITNDSSNQNQLSSQVQTGGNGVDGYRLLWDVSLCNCCIDMPHCCMACWCLPCYVFYLSELMGESYLPPLLSLIACPTFNCCIPLSILRLKLRHMHKINGSLSGDACISCLCMPCAVCQMRNQLMYTIRVKGGNSMACNQTQGGAGDAPAPPAPPVQLSPMEGCMRCLCFPCQPTVPIKAGNTMTCNQTQMAPIKK